MLAVPVAIAMIAPAGARADASEMTCTIESLSATGDIEWAWNAIFGAEERITVDVAVSGTASCVHPRTGSWTATLSSSDATITSNWCYFPGQGSARLAGTLDITLSNGLKDHRRFSIGYQPDTNEPVVNATMNVDGGQSTVVQWRFPPTSTSRRCEIGNDGTAYSRIDYTGTFAVPLSTSNPKLFAKDDGVPGHPDPIAVNQSTGRVYVGSFTTALTVLADRPAPSLEPSRVTEYDLGGNRLRDWAINGQNTSEGHGLTGIALDSAGRLYITDVAPARVVRLDPASGAQSTYGTIPDFDESAQSRFGNRKPLPNGAAFGPDGSLYVTDTTQGVIWRVPPGGGTAQKWFSHPSLVSFIGPNGIRLMADQKTLLFVVSNSHPPGAVDGLQGKVYKLPIQTGGAPGSLSTFWTGATNEGPDSLAIAQSGNVYVAEAGDGARTGFVVLSPAGREIARRASPTQRLTADVAYDTTADVAFAGTKVLFTNSANFTGNVANMAIFAYDVGDPGLPILRPALP